MPDMEYLKRATEINPEVIANRRYLHQHPELAFDLDNTVRFVKEKLTEMGYAPADCGDHGVVALAGGRKPGKCILIRADMDALPMKEESGLEFSSLTDSAAHTCGHDTHTAMLLGAAKLLKEMEDEIPGTVKLMFQPAEEMGTGAENMLKAGVLENPHVDASFGIHIFAAVPAGVLVYGNGPMLSSCDVFEITVKGKGGHGSMPNDTVDPIMVGAHILTALESINSREIAPDSFGVLTVGCFQSGSKFNIIPDTAFMTGTIRTFDSEVRAFIKKRLVELAEGTARAYRAEATVGFPTQICAVITDKDVARIVGESVAAAVGAPRVIGNFKPIAGSEDFGYITSEVPSTFFGLGGCPTDYPAYPQHSPNIRFNEDAFPVGVAAYVSGAIGWLQSQAKEA